MKSLKNRRNTKIKSQLQKVKSKTDDDLVLSHKNKPKEEALKWYQKLLNRLNIAYEKSGLKWFYEKSGLKILNKHLGILSSGNAAIILA
ncbi:MAG: hypothetical protein HRU35_08270, partial [Rickettsiaceae bacterium]|nr:hypothetical protein [Rickettsiaceae bacterium]